MFYALIKHRFLTNQSTRRVLSNKLLTINFHYFSEKKLYLSNLSFDNVFIVF